MYQMLDLTWEILQNLGHALLNSKLLGALTSFVICFLVGTILSKHILICLKQDKQGALILA